MDFLIQLAHGALALLVAVLAMYLSLKLLGKIVKYVVIALIAVATAIVLFVIFSDAQILQSIKDMITALPAVAAAVR